MSRVDKVYRSIVLTTFFNRGWGKPENLKRIFEFRRHLSDREICKHLISPYHPIHIKKVEKTTDYVLIDGQFTSPFVQYMGDVLPLECHTAHFQLLAPASWPKASKLTPLCIHLAGTGDHFFWRRRTLMARPLLKDSGIASIILENPFYGLRKPAGQVRSSLNNVSDIFLMGGCLMMECHALLHWAERHGFGPLALTGISMGGHMASIAACNWPKPVALVPCLSWSSASGVFTEGVMSDSVNWALLENQYLQEYSYRHELMKMVNPAGSGDSDAAFEAGRHFAQNFPSSLGHIESVSRIIQVEEEKEGKIKVGEKLETQEKPVVEEKKSQERSVLNLLSKMPLVQKTVASPLGGSSLTSGLNLNLRFSASKSKITNMKPERSKTEKDKLHSEALQFMKGIMDECTFLGNFAQPVDPSLIISVIAKDDAYVPRGHLPGLPELWPGMEVRYIDTGHVTAFVFRMDHFRKAILDALEKSADKYYS
ncbi:unnamed protein product [Darwinula stevensoni]|uniref:Protein ABHD18 n=1 Tax=Darwinula stevensoni TaxID=69355 RepID=A0A7R8X9S5_9CRUS|nr:unnamed protein product [Darwinula stevensoni]CAG0882812.1 unnamed protein product [Darwinula stevensoni]